MLLVPNFIEKPLKLAYKGFKTGRNSLRHYNKVKNYKLDNDFKNNYINYISHKNFDYKQKYGTVKGTAKDRARGLKEALAANDKEIKSYYLNDKNFEQFINDNSSIKPYFDEAPEYAYFCFKEGLDPNDVKTANKFIQRQETSIRGVNNIPEDKLEESVTFAFGDRPYELKGGDQIGSNGGLYTSNSGNLNANKSIFVDEFGNGTVKVANRFAIPFDAGGTGYVTLLHTDFGVDPNLPPLEQIRQFKNKSIDYDVVNADRIEKLTEPSASKVRLRNKSIFDQSNNIYNSNDFVRKSERQPTYKRKLANPDILAFNHHYFNNNIYERVLLTTKPKDKVADLIDASKVISDSPRKDRWSSVMYDYDDGLFLPYKPSNDFRSLLRYSRIRENSTVRFPNDRTIAYENRLNKHMIDKVTSRDRLINKLLDAQQKIKNTENTLKSLGKAGALILATTAPIYGLIKYKQNNEKAEWDAMTDEEFFNYYNKYGKGDGYIDEYYNERKNKAKKKYGSRLSLEYNNN